MASGGAAALTLKLAVVAAVLALLVIPSLGRCPSRGPAPPPPTHAPPSPLEAIPPSPPAQAPPPPLEAIPPAPAPGPPLTCDICNIECFSDCMYSYRDTSGMTCDETCGNEKSRCDQCVTPEMEECRATCTGSCDCFALAEAPESCRDDCFSHACQLSWSRRDKYCQYECNNDYCFGNHCYGP
ncbi:hypothetical protein CFC21_104624 [Triticum aestivum]|uniref:Uncharacterized protein n=2 Tax=Triticum aestivum TaxID=4565 RepID=A0A9R1MAH0_WHEAT|nr:hypothetical protein CFC21_104624 [Triticum aestivum]